jgi:hypothetical protein
MKLLTVTILAIAISLATACSDSVRVDQASASGGPPDEARVKAVLDQWFDQQFGSERGEITNVGPLLSPNEGEIEVQFKGTQRGTYRATFRRAVGGKCYLAEVFDGSRLYQPNLEVK